VKSVLEQVLTDVDDAMMLVVELFAAVTFAYLRSIDATARDKVAIEGGV
jgi:hypothetical protein